MTGMDGEWAVAGAGVTHLFSIVGILFSFLCGSLMFSYGLGLLARKNLDAVGDGNPGAVNLWRSAGFKFGLAGVILDFLKGYFPVFLLLKSGLIHGYEAPHYAVVSIAIAPVLGHSFTPFLKGRGGKGIAVTFGVWSALTAFEASVIYAAILAILLVIGRIVNHGRPVSKNADGFQVVCGMLLLSVYLWLRVYESAVLVFWLCNFLLLAFNHRNELLQIEKGKSM